MCLLPGIRICGWRLSLVTPDLVTPRRAMGSLFMISDIAMNTETPHYTVSRRPRSCCLDNVGIVMTGRLYRYLRISLTGYLPI